MSRSKTELTITIALLAAAFLTSLILRIALPWNQVFSGDWIKFTDNDAYFYMRLLDNLAANFPRMTVIDPWSWFGNPQNLSGYPMLFVYLMGAVAWLLGGGSPSQHMVDLTGVYFPAVLGALLVFPVFFITRAVFNKWAGLLAAAVIALLPGEFLVRTLLGNTDIHVMEIFITTLFMLFLLLAVKYGKGFELRLLKEGKPHAALPMLIYASLAGLCLGAYLLSWSGALLFVFISFVWLVIQFIADYVKGRSADCTGITGIIVFTVALLMALPVYGAGMNSASLLVGLAASAGLWLLSWLLRRFRLPSYAYPASVLLLAAAGMLLLWIISPALLQSMLGTLSGFFSWQTGTTIAEMQPLLIQNGSFSLALAWGNYTLSSLFALASLCLLVYLAFRKAEPEAVLLLTWTLIILMATLAMRRFAYYLAVDVAILAGYSYWLLFRLTAGLKAGENSAAAGAQTAGSRDKKRSASKKRRQGGLNLGRLALAAAVTAVLVIYPNTGPLPGGDRPFYDVTQKGLYTQSDGWSEALDWLRQNTEPPMGKATDYYSLYNPSAQAFEYPASAYCVLSWWDYGYWIARTSQRIPYANPGSAQRGEQFFLMSQDEASASRLIAGWKVRYVMLDSYLADWQKGFRVLCGTAGQPSANYCEIYYRRQGGSLSATLLYYPEYYRTMAVRLYCFNGQQYTPSETAVIRWEPRTASDGLAYKEIMELKTFRGYDGALEFVDSQQTGNWRVVGKDPAVSPVPLEQLEGYRPVFSSGYKIKSGSAEIPDVKIFEYNQPPQ